MYSRETAIDYSKKLPVSAKQLPLKIDNAILFVSVFNGKNHEYSDIDVVLFSKSFTDNVIENLQLFSKVASGFYDHDIKTYNSAYFYSGEGLLLDEKKETGIEVKLINNCES